MPLINVLDLFLIDFKKYFSNLPVVIGEEVKEHPCTYFEDESIIIFYKPVGNVVYRTSIPKLVV